MVKLFPGQPWPDRKTHIHKVSTRILHILTRMKIHTKCKVEEKGKWAAEDMSGHRDECECGEADRQCVHVCLFTEDRQVVSLCANAWVVSMYPRSQREVMSGKLLKQEKKQNTQKSTLHIGYVNYFH